MADDINKKITIDVQVNTDGQQQIDNLGTSISGLGKPLAAFSKNIVASGQDLVQLNTLASKSAASTAGSVQSSIGKVITGIKKLFANAIGFYKTQGKESTQNAADAGAKAAKTIADTTNAATTTVIDTAKKATVTLADTAKTTTATTTDAAKKAVDSSLIANDKMLTAAVTNAQKISDSVFTIVTKGIEQQSDAKVRALEADKTAELTNTSLTAAQKTAITDKFKKQEDQIKLKAFKEEQKASVAQAVINGAVAVMKADATLGPVGGTIALGAIIAQTAAQIATIERQQPPALAKGGYFSSDGKGALLPGYSRTDNTNAYLRSGEAVVVSEAMRNPWARNLVSAINVGFGGRDFSTHATGSGYAVGGIFTDGGDANRYYNQPVNDQKNLANTIAYQMINNFPPVYVDVKDVNNQQNILAQTINRVNL